MLCYPLETVSYSFHCDQKQTQDELDKEPVIRGKKEEKEKKYDDRNNVVYSFSNCDREQLKNEMNGKPVIRKK